MTITSLSRKDSQNSQQTGSTLVEFALVSFLLLTMMLGITEFSRAVYAYHFVSNAAREASRYAAVRGSTCKNDTDGIASCWNDSHCADYATSACIGSYVSSIAPNGINSSSTGCGGSGCLSTSVTWPVQSTSPTLCGTTYNYPGCTVHVQVSYDFQFLFPFVSRNGITLSSTSDMIIAH